MITIRTQLYDTYIPNHRGKEMQIFAHALSQFSARTVNTPRIQGRRHKTICRSPQLIAVLNRKKTRRRRGKSKERSLAGSKGRLGDGASP